MKICIYSLTLVAIAVIAALPAPAQQPAAPAASQTPVVKTTVDEVVLDFIARDKKGKPVTDLKPDELAVSDNGAKQQPTSFRLVQGAEAISQGGTTTKLDPLRQLRLVTLSSKPWATPPSERPPAPVRSTSLRASRAATSSIQSSSSIHACWFCSSLRPIRMHSSRPSTTPQAGTRPRSCFPNRIGSRAI